MSTPDWRMAYAQGWSAYLDGGTNPYSVVSEPSLRWWWNKGYRDSRRQNK